MLPTQRRYRERVMEEMPAPLGSALRETAREAWLYSPFSSIGRMNELTEAEDGPIDLFGVLRGDGLRGEPDSPVLSAEDARARVRERDLDLEIPDTGIRERALQIIMDRKADEKRRQDILNRSPAGFLAGSARFATALGVSMLDPLNVAASFIPVVGPARYTSMLARAATPAARMGVRARVGAVEGLAGAAIVEPLVIGATTQEQADYGLMDTFLNLTLGTALGGGLHVGGGAIADAVSRGRPWQTAKAADPRGQMIESLPPEVRNAAIRTAVAQAVDGRQINVEPVISLGRAEGPIVAADGQPAPRTDEAARTVLARYDYDIQRMIDAGEDVNAVMRNASREDAGRAVQNQEVAFLRNEIADLKALEAVPNRYAEGLRRTDRASDDEMVFERGFSASTRSEVDAQTAKAEQRLSDLEEFSSRNVVAPDILESVDFGRQPRPEAGSHQTSPDQLARLNASAKASFQPENHRLVDMEASARADEQVKQAARPEEARAQQELDDAMEELASVAEALGVDAQARMSELDELADTAAAYGRAVEAAVECRLRRGS